MKVLVSVKRVIDANVRIQVKADNTGVDLTNAKMAINPFDEIALEEAIRLKESGKADSVVAVTVGNESCQETLRTALAMGADRAVRVDSDIELESLSVAKLLAAVVAREAPGMVLLGKQAIDDDNNQTGQMLAALLGWGQGTFASDIELAGNEVELNREIDGGLERIALKLPAVITTDLRLNEPRYVKLPNIMKAKKKPLDLLTPGELGVDVTPRLTLLRVEEPLQRGRGVKVADVSDLVDKLRYEARVI